MKKTIIILSAIALSISVTSLFSCRKKYTNTNQLATLGRATISGNVFARLADTVGAADTQYAPVNTMIGAWIDTREFLYYSSSSPTPYAIKYYTAKVDDNGQYRFNLDVSKYQGAIVHIMPVKFTYDQVKNVHHTFDSVYTVNKTFSSDTLTIFIGNDSNIVQTIQYIYN
jgi:hypothetical protein